MDLEVIYKDDNMTVEIPRLAVNKLNKIYNDIFRLTDEEFKPLLQERAVDYLRSNHPETFEMQEMNIITSKEIQRLHRGEIFELLSIWEIFTDAIILLSQYFDDTEGKVSNDWKYNIEQIIYYHYKLTYEEDCIVHFFEENYCGVSGFMAIRYEDKLFIKFISLNEEDKTWRLFE